MKSGKSKLAYALLYALISIILINVEVRNTTAQSATVSPIQCGNIIEASIRQPGTVQSYSLELEMGDTLIIDINRISTANAPRVIIFDSNGNQLIGLPWEQPVREVEVPFSDNWILEVSDNTISSYILSVGCKIRKTGELIEAGSVIAPVVTEIPSANINNIPVSQLPSFLSTVTVVPMSILPDLPMTGVITANEILGYNLAANANDVLSLAFTRVSGTLNLNLVILSPERQVVFQTSLVTSSNLTTQLTLPTTGNYTIVVFQVELFSPQSPEPAAFEIKVSYNKTS